MDIMELGAIGDLVGGVAVIASLVFVGLQVRQGNALAQGAAELEVGRMNMDYLRLGAESNFSAIWYTGFYTPDSLPEQDKARWIWAQGMWLHMVQAMYRQFQRGVLPESSWIPLLAAIATMLEENSIMAEIWERNAMYLADDFRTYVDTERPHVARGGFMRSMQMATD